MMKTRDMEKLLDQLSDLLAQHGHTLANAAEVQARDLVQEAAGLESYLESLSHNPGRPTPERLADLDASSSLFTVNGYRQTARLFRESAARLREASEALESMQEAMEDRDLG